MAALHLLLLAKRRLLVSVKPSWTSSAILERECTVLCVESGNNWRMTVLALALFSTFSTFKCAPHHGHIFKGILAEKYRG